MRSHSNELLSPPEAEAVSGYSRRRLRELEAEGKLVNHGKKGAPRYRRGDLPIKPRDGFNAVAEAKRLLAS